MISNRDDSVVYTGYTNDLAQRLWEHNYGKGKVGAKATKAKRPWKYVSVQRYSTKSAAMSEEYARKQWTRPKKLKWIRAHPYNPRLSYSSSLSSSSSSSSSS
jgi:putative endonuclease